MSTGVEFHNAGSQTKPKKRPDKGIQLFCRETQVNALLYPFRMLFLPDGIESDTISDRKEEVNLR